MALNINVNDYIPKHKYIRNYASEEEYQQDVDNHEIEECCYSVINSDNNTEIAKYTPSVRTTNGDNEVQLTYYTNDILKRWAGLKIVWGYFGWEENEYTLNGEVLKGGKFYNMKPMNAVYHVDDLYQYDHLNDFLSQVDPINIYEPNDFSHIKSAGLLIYTNAKDELFIPKEYFNLDSLKNVKYQYINGRSTSLYNGLFGNDNLKLITNATEINYNNMINVNNIFFINNPCIKCDSYNKEDYKIISKTFNQPLTINIDKAETMDDAFYMFNIAQHNIFNNNSDDIDYLHYFNKKSNLTTINNLFPFLYDRENIVLNIYKVTETLNIKNLLHNYYYNGGGLYYSICNKNIIINIDSYNININYILLLQSNNYSGKCIQNNNITLNLKKATINKNDSANYQTWLFFIDKNIIIDNPIIIKFFDIYIEASQGYNYNYFNFYAGNNIYDYKDSYSNNIMLYIKKITIDCSKSSYKINIDNSKIKIIPIDNDIELVHINNNPTKNIIKIINKNELIPFTLNSIIYDQLESIILHYIDIDTPINYTNIYDNNYEFLFDNVTSDINININTNFNNENFNLVFTNENHNFVLNNNEFTIFNNATIEDHSNSNKVYCGKSIYWNFSKTDNCICKLYFDGVYKVNYSYPLYLVYYKFTCIDEESLDYFKLEVELAENSVAYFGIPNIKNSFINIKKVDLSNIRINGLNDYTNSKDCQIILKEYSISSNVTHTFDDSLTEEDFYIVHNNIIDAKHVNSNGSINTYIYDNNVSLYRNMYNMFTDEEKETMITKFGTITIKEYEN